MPAASTPQIATTLRIADVQSDAGVRYRNPHLAILVPVRRDGHVARTIVSHNSGGAQYTTDSNGAPAGPPAPPDGHTFQSEPSPPITSTSHTDFLFVADSYVPAIQPTIVDPRWRSDWRLGFLVLPGMRRYNANSHPTSVVETVTPPKIIGWYSASEALVALNALPADNVADGPFDTGPNLQPASQGGIPDGNWNAILAFFAPGIPYEETSPFSPVPTNWLIGDSANEYIDDVTTVLPAMPTPPAGYQVIFQVLNLDFMNLLLADESRAAALLAALLAQKMLCFDPFDDPGNPTVGNFVASKTRGKSHVGIDDTLHVWKAYSYVNAKYKKTPALGV